LQPKLNKIPGMRVYMQNPPAIRIGGRISKSLYQYTLSSPDVDQLYKSAQLMLAKMRTSNTLADVTSDLQIENPQANVVVDRDKASALGVTAQAVESALYSAYGQRQVSPIYTSNNEYWVVVQVQERFQNDPAMLSELYIHSSSGELVPLSAVSKFVTGVGPLTVNHTGQLPSVTISFNLKPGVALGNAVNEIESLSRSTLPISIQSSFQGTAQAFQQSLTGLGILLIATVAVIYIVLGILYESFIHPATILTGLPFAAFGALLALWIFRMELDVYGFVGLILLIGIVKKNAIMMIDFALEAERRENKTPTEAIVEAASVRFRPIMMTTMAALMATLPIALGTGSGADARRPLGVVVVGGLAFSQLVTLYVTPVFYTYFDELPERVRGLTKRTMARIRERKGPSLAPSEP
jgi:hydrophobic/amphiphilic exporter-1 (mainly G- bacteria), HAE1 family